MMLTPFLRCVTVKRLFQTSCCLAKIKCRPLDPRAKKYMKCRKEAKLESCIIDDSLINPCWPLPKVVIVGAGMAGLSAASKLGKSGFSDITVLEATDRPGGRIHSCWIGNAVAEIGAMHIHGSSIANSVFPLAAREGLVSEPYMKEKDEGLVMTCEGEIVSLYVTAAATACFNIILKQAADLFITCGPGAKCGSLHDFVSSRIDQEMKHFPPEYRRLAAKVMVGKMIDLESKIGAELKKVAACQFGTLVDIPGGNIKIPSGMVGILAPLIREMPKCDTIRYCKAVDRITWNNDEDHPPRCRIFCNDGDILCADYIIFTPSVGAMRKYAKTMFDPPLPQEKVKAYDEMGFGLINHVYLEYEKPFWVWSEGGLRLGWNYHQIDDRSTSWMNGISSINELSTSQQVLQVTVGGEAAAIVEGLTDAQIAQDITALHRKFLNDPTLPYPVNIIRSRWQCSPYFAGAKTYFGLETTLKTQCELGKPVPDGCTEDPVLFFAGEATAIGAHGTMHGARSSGLREADKIIALTKKLKGKPRKIAPCDQNQPEEQPCRVQCRSERAC